MNAPFNMAATIIARSDQLNADDLLAGPRTITVRKVSAGESGEQPVNVYYDGDDNKPFKPCKTIRRVMVGLWGGDANQYIGRSMTLVRDATVLFGGMQVGGIRISHMSHIDGEQTVVVMKAKGKKAPIKIRPLQAATPRTPAVTPLAAPVSAPITEAGQDRAVSTDSKRVASRKWLDARVQQIATMQDVSSLAEFQAKHAGNVPKVEAAYPEWADEFDAAVRARLSELAAADGGADVGEQGVKA